MKLHLGVIDIPYASESTTTGDVATFIEEKYGLMQSFADRHADEIAKSVAESLAGAAADFAQYGVTVDPIADAAGDIEQMFRSALDAREYDGEAGIPTEAAKKGVSHRFKKKNYGGERPSFIDTGTYQASFKVWTE